MAQILIAHRGNYQGCNIERENSPEYLKEALDAGYDIEVDIWLVDGIFWFGHDKPQYKRPNFGIKFLTDERVWCHAKNVEALDVLLSINHAPINCFWHENDKFTITSQRYIWTFPRHQLTPRSIAVYPELYPDGTDFSIAAGICSDNIKDYK